MLAFPLLPSGCDLPVTKSSLLQYVYLFAHHHLNHAIAHASRHFIAGFRALVPTPWIRLFNVSELQRLLSGDEQQGLDVANMRANVVYTTYSDHEEYIQRLWECIANFSPEDQRLFLRFITSIPRQPLLGFQSLTPKLCIQKVSPFPDLLLHQCTADNIRLYQAAHPRLPMKLPSAATCMNLLKLPYYGEDPKVLEEKLLYAIRSNSGFELS